MCCQYIINYKNSKYTYIINLIYRKFILSKRYLKISSKKQKILYEYYIEYTNVNWFSI